MTEIELINTLGGTTAVAKLCGIRPQAVSQWKKKGIPKTTKRLLIHYQHYTEIQNKLIAANPDEKVV